MRTNNEPYLILVEQDGCSHVVTWHEFERANASDPDLVEDAKCLAPGFGFTIGGGAAPIVKISRWS